MLIDKYIQSLAKEPNVAYKLYCTVLHYNALLMYVYPLYCTIHVVPAQLANVSCIASISVVT